MAARNTGGKTAGATSRSSRGEMVLEILIERGQELRLARAQIEVAAPEEAKCRTMA